MAVNIVQKEIKFYSELVNGTDFDLNLSESTPTLADSPTGRCQSVSTVDVTVGINISNFQIILEGSGVDDNTNPNYQIIKDDATFLSEGITVGADIALTFDPGGNNGPNIPFYNVYFIVTAVTDTVINVTYDGAGGSGDDISLADLYGHRNHPGNSEGDYNLYSNPGYIAINPAFTALQFAYNLIENSAGSPSLTSKLSNTENVVKVRDIPTVVDATVQTGVAKTKNKAWVMSDTPVSVELKEKIFNSNAMLQLRFGSRYEVKHEFIIPYYYDGEDEFLEDTTTPPDLYNGTSSPKYIYKTTWYTDINDPNTGVTTTYDSSKGNCGYLDEAFNGDENPYTVSNLVYQDITANESTDRLNIGKVTRVTFDVANSESDFSASQVAVIAHGAILDSDEYSSSTDVFSDVWTFDTLRSTAGLGDVSNGMIKDYSITYNSVSSISIQFDIEFSTPQNSRLEENQYYVLALQLRGDALSPVSESHKVHLKIDYNQYGKDNDIPGLFGVARFEQIPHPVTLESSPVDTIGYTNAQYDIEEGSLALVEFWLDTSKEGKLEQLDFQIGVYDQTKNVRVLRNLNLNLSDSVLSNGVWQLRVSETVGYPLKEGDQFNLKSLINGDKVGSKQFYTMIVGYKIPWQDWIAFAKAPTELFDPSLPLDGLNNNASNYSTDGTYQCRLFVSAKVSQYGVSTDYLEGSQNVNVYGYDEDDSLLNDTYTCTIGTFDEDKIPIEGNIIEDEYTQIKATFTPLVPPVFTTSVDMSDAASNWFRFAHGNHYTINTGGETERVTQWVNQQANDTDTFTNTAHDKVYTKNEFFLYSSTPSQVLAIENMGAYHGMYSKDLYEYYDLTGKMFSNGSADDDCILYTVAFMVDDQGVEHTLSLVSTCGGILMDRSPNYVPGDTTTDIYDFKPFSSPNDQCSVALVYDYGKDGFTNLYQFYTGVSGQQWQNVGDVIFSVNRSSNELTFDIDWFVGASSKIDSFTYDLNDNEFTKKFNGYNSLGFGFHSQNLGGFKDIVLTKPDADYWGAVRIESKNNLSDKGLFELSNDIEGDTQNLLKQLPSEDLIVSTLSWDNTSFVLQALVNTNRTKSGEDYKISAEIGAVNIGTLNLLASFSWVDDIDRSKLHVKFNTGIDLDLVTTTGLTIQDGGITITGFVIGESVGNTLTFTLSADIDIETNNTFIYGGTNTIKSLDNSLSLAANSKIIYDI